jgi:hypothetical protein
VLVWLSVLTLTHIPTAVRSCTCAHPQLPRSSHIKPYQIISREINKKVNSIVVYNEALGKCEIFGKKKKSKAIPVTGRGGP